MFDLLGIDEMQAAQGALRHGVLYDLLDREQGDTDVRSTTVQRLATKFGVDAAQADARRQRGRCTCCASCAPAPDQPAELARHERKLAWAAQLHEIGSQISHSDYHKHGAYILDNADAPGFAQPELHRLSLLVLGHRGKLRKLEADFDDRAFVQQLLCLRLAVILCHARRDPDLQGPAAAVGRAAQLHACAAGPAGARPIPQSAHLLREEAWPGRRRRGRSSWPEVRQVGRGWTGHQRYKLFIPFRPQRGSPWPPP